MSVFRWTAPLFKWSRRRWTEADFRRVAGYLRPYVPPGGILLDLGGGTGDLGLGVARALGADVVVADITAEMLYRVSPHPSISVRLTAAETLPFPAGHFDALLCSDAFHHFRDQDAATREMARVVRPGGGVLVLEIRPTGWGRLVSAGERMIGEPAAFHRPEDLQRLLRAHGISGEIVERGRLSYLLLGSNMKGDESE